jgi:type I restriction enzyme M protein
MPNDLFDLEYAPYELDTKEIIETYERQLKVLNDQFVESEKELEAVEKKLAEKETKTLSDKIKKLKSDIEAQKEKIANLESEKTQVTEIIETYYVDDKLKADYAERTDTDLIRHFKNGLLSRYKSDDIVLRTTELQTILDNIRKEVIWD